MVSFRGGTTSSDDTDYRCSCSSASSNLHGEGSYLRPATVRHSCTNTGAASAPYKDRFASNGVPDDGTDAASSIDASSGTDAAGSID